MTIVYFMHILWNKDFENMLLRRAGFRSCEAQATVIVGPQPQQILLIRVIVIPQPFVLGDIHQVERGGRGSK